MLIGEVFLIMQVDQIFKLSKKDVLIVSDGPMINYNRKSSGK